MRNRTATALLSAASALCLCACASSQRAPFNPVIESGAHHPPPFITAELSESRTSARVTLEFPHPGWNYILDAHRAADATNEVFFTIYRPDPRADYPQVIKTVTETIILDDRPTLTIYARHIEHDLRDLDVPYRLAATAR